MGELQRNSVPWTGVRGWLDWFPAISKGLSRWVLLGGADAERRATVRDGKAKEAADKKARRSWWRESRRHERERERVVAAQFRARVKWAKAVLRREAASGGVACEVKPGEEARMVWPVARPASPGEAERAAAESERGVIELAELRIRTKRERDRERAEVQAVQLGVHGGPGASARGVLAAKRARWAYKRGLECGDLGVRKRSGVLAVRDCGVDTDVVMQGPELSTPEVERQNESVDRSRRRCRGRYLVKFKISGSSARRMLRLLRLQMQRRGRERDRGGGVRKRLSLTLASRI